MRDFGLILIMCGLVLIGAPALVDWCLARLVK